MNTYFMYSHLILFPESLQMMHVCVISEICPPENVLLHQRVSHNEAAVYVSKGAQ